MLQLKQKNQNRRLTRQCAVCGGKISILIRPDHSYRGGHYFGKIPLYRKTETAKALKSGTHASRVGKFTFQVLNKDPKPYSHAEYWECPRCYRG